MAIQYAGGTIVNATFTSDGTRGNLVSNLNTQLKNAGWTAVSGDGTGDVLMQSATTPQGLSIRFRLYDPGSGNCAQITMRNDGTPSALTSAIAYMLPTNGKSFRIIANKYQFFLFSSGNAYYQTHREFVAGGAPWVPSYVLTDMGSDLQCGWMQYNGTSDAGAAAGSWRYRLNQNNTGASVDALFGASLYTGWMLSYSGGLNQSPPSFPQTNVYSYQQYCYRWQTGHVLQIEPLIMWSSTSANTGEGKFKGQLWDAFLLAESIDGESTVTFDGHTYLAITHQAPASYRMTLMVGVD